MMALYTFFMIFDWNKAKTTLNNFKNPAKSLKRSFVILKKSILM